MTDAEKIMLLQNQLFVAYKLLKLTAKPEAYDKITAFGKEIDATLERTSLHRRNA